MSFELPFLALGAWFARGADDSAGDDPGGGSAPAAQGATLQGSDARGRPPGRPGETFIGPGVRLAGSLRCAGDVTVQGRMEGPLSAEGSVLVERGGHAEGDITAGVIRVRGRTQGALAASTEIVLEQGCQHRGGLSGPELVVEAGALVEGEVRVGPHASTAGRRPADAPRGGPGARPQP